MEFNTHFGGVPEEDEDLEITVWMKAKRAPESNRANRSWDDLPEYPEKAEEPALRVDFDAIGGTGYQGGGVPHPDASRAPVYESKDETPV
jgi:hypothetical protein